MAPAREWRRSIRGTQLLTTKAEVEACITPGYTTTERKDNRGKHGIIHLAYSPLITSPISHELHCFRANHLRSQQIDKAKTRGLLLSNWRVILELVTPVHIDT